VSEDDVYLDARAVFLIEYLRQPRKPQRFYLGAVETALEHRYHGQRTYVEDHVVSEGK
jgi:hypothetical protein